MPTPRLFCASNRTRSELYVGRAGAPRLSKRWLLGPGGPRGLAGWMRSDLIIFDHLGEVPHRYLPTFLRGFAESHRGSGLRLLSAAGGLI